MSAKSDVSIYRDTRIASTFSTLPQNNALVLLTLQLMVVGQLGFGVGLSIFATELT